MKKFSKLNESVRIDVDKIEQALSKLTNCEYEIFDYFVGQKPYAGSKSKYLSLVDSIEDIESGFRNAKLLKIRFDANSENGNIDGWYEKLKFNSSGFDFFKDTSGIISVLNLIKELNEYSPSLCLKDNYFLICLFGDELTEEDGKTRDNMKLAAQKLYDNLKDRTDLFVKPSSGLLLMNFCVL